MCSGYTFLYILNVLECIKSYVIKYYVWPPLSTDEHPVCLEIKPEYWKLYTKANMELLCFTGVRIVVEMVSCFSSP